MHGRKHRDSHQALLRRLRDMAEGKLGTMSSVAEGKQALRLGWGAWGCLHVGLQTRLVAIPPAGSCFALLPCTSVCDHI